MLLATPTLAFAQSDLGLSLSFCKPGVTVADIDVARDCTLPTRPEPPSEYGTTKQYVLATINEPGQVGDVADTAQVQDEVALWVTPYYLRQIVIFQQQADVWTPIAEGGASLGSDRVSARLGGHWFELPVSRGTSQYLLEITAPHFAHLAVGLDTSGQASNRQEVMLSMHLGMLLLLFLLVVGAWAIRPAALEARLTVLTGFVLLSVVIGSGAIYRLWPGASIHWVGFFLFNAVVALRIGAITWVYASLIGPYNSRPSYRVLNGITYAVTAAAVVLFGLNLPSFGWPLLGVLLLLALLAPAWGLLTAKPMPRMLSVAVLGSVLFYLVLNLFAFYSLMTTTGQNDAPVYMIRAVDLALPLVLFAVIILRNRVTDRELEQAKAEITAKVSELKVERRVNEEKRLLLDMLTHEIKNPLASIRFAVRNLGQATNTDGELRMRKLQSIVQSVQSIDEIIERCNLANGLEEDRIEPQVGVVRMDQLVRDLIDASEQKNRFMVSLAEVPAIQSDPYLVKIVMANLLDNACKYATASSPIAVSVAHDRVRDQVIVKVSNPIDPAMVLDAGQMFNRYYRHESAQHIRGSGLGLPLCRAVCHLLGANLACHLQPGRIEFEVTFENP